MLTLVCAAGIDRYREQLDQDGRSLNVERKSVHKLRLLFLLLPICVINATPTLAEDVSLHCALKDSSDQKIYNYRIIIDDRGADEITDKGYHIYNTNDETHYFRKNEYETVYGATIRFPTFVRYETTIDRVTGVYTMTKNGEIKIKGTCTRDALR
jgi:hypothetical protein